MGNRMEPYKNTAGIYDEIRPGYPAQLIQDIIARTNIKEGSTLLEVGAGTGKATLPFADKGFRVHAIEIGKDMAEVLKEKTRTYPNVSVEISSFEEWIPKKTGKFDMIFSAQAFHWLDPEVKYKRCHELLKDGGYLVLFWYSAVRGKSEKSQDLDKKINEIIRHYAKGQSIEKKPERSSHPGVFDKENQKAEIEESGLFEVSDIIRYKAEVKNNAGQYLKAQKSVPAFASILDVLDEEAIQEMEERIINEINKNGGYVETIFDYTLYIAKKVNG